MTPRQLSITSDGFDDKGLRWAKCERCGMGWIERREGAELFPGEMVYAGKRDHECPPTPSYRWAKMMLDFCLATGAVVSQRIKAQIRLGLNSDPRIEGE